MSTQDNILKLGEKASSKTFSFNSKGTQKACVVSKQKFDIIGPRMETSPRKSLTCAAKKMSVYPSSP
jgi:hypothetical protein